MPDPPSANNTTGPTASSTLTNEMQKAQVALEAADLTAWAAFRSIKSALASLTADQAAKPAVAAADSTAFATVKSLMAVRAAFDALQEAQAQLMKERGEAGILAPTAEKEAADVGRDSETSHSAPSSDVQRLTTPSVAFGDLDFSSSSGSSWSDPYRSSSPQPSLTSSDDATSVFPEEPVIFLREWQGATQLIASWEGYFIPYKFNDGSLSRIVYTYDWGREIPASMSAIRFELPSQNLLVRAPGQNDRWIIVTQQQPPVTEQPQVEPVESQVGKWWDGQRQEQREEKQTEAKEQVEAGDKDDDLEDNVQERKAREDEQEIIVDHQDGKDKQKEEGH